MSQNDDDADPFRHKRDAMIAQQLVARGIHSARVLNAMSVVPREKFVSADQREHAYDDAALPSMNGQTISQPYIVAFMSELLDVRPADRILEIGTGTGYQTAILAKLAERGEVFSIERIAALSDSARAMLASMGISNVRFLVGDGTLGWPGAERFDRILITAGTPEIPPPLLSQLADGGILVAPRGMPEHQRLVVITRCGDSFSERERIPVRFVPLIGKHAWPTDPAP
jgi:protein-L-isoaspartate(D-aspartate) O-methyltransferase